MRGKCKTARGSVIKNEYWIFRRRCNRPFRGRYRKIFKQPFERLNRVGARCRIFFFRYFGNKSIAYRSCLIFNRIKNHSCFGCFGENKVAVKIATRHQFAFRQNPDSAFYSGFLLHHFSKRFFLSTHKPLRFHPIGYFKAEVSSDPLGHRKQEQKPCRSNFHIQRDELSGILFYHNLSHAGRQVVVKNIHRYSSVTFP